MILFQKNIHTILFLGLFVMIFHACERPISADAVPASFPKNGEVFIDGFSSGLEYLPFADSYFEAFSVDEDTKQDGTASMRFDIPSVGDPNGAYSGAIFPDYGARDLSEFDALVFWAKATKAATLNEVGFGIDFEEDAFSVSLTDLALSTNWRKYSLAIPDPSKLTQERGLFWYAEGPEDGEGYSLWIDELEFISTDNITNAQATIANGDDITIGTFTGTTNPISGLSYFYTDENGNEQKLNIAPAYFDFISSDPSVATVDENGNILALASGTAVINAKVGDSFADGSISVQVGGNFESAPTPQQDEADVISIFSDSYANKPVDYYNGYWAPFQTTTGDSEMINGDNVLSYKVLNFVGIQFAVNVPTIDVSEMTHFHADIQPLQGIQAGDFFTVTLLDAGADNTIGTDDDSTADITLNADDLSLGNWASIDIPFSSLGSLSQRANLAQIIFVTDGTIKEVYVDNVYFYKGDDVGGTSPSQSAPVPTQSQNNVISIFSDAYTNLSGTDFNPNWGQNTSVSQIAIDGNNTLLYEGFNYQGVAFASGVDVTEMEFLHIDYWSANASNLNAFIISPGPVETAVALDVPTNGWHSIDINLSEFTPVDLLDVFQMKFEGNGDIYLDNMYFFKN